ncbi:MAG: alpha-glucan family phosphorylase, partial [Bifidobacteriaceae bacterium]|nr:alpha-glucan family phosphorylase [Bifidobacteriaceae bacterium]
MKLIGRFTVRTVLPAALAPLNRLATNLRWSWTPSTQALFEEMDPDLWAKVHGDPVALLGALTPERLEELSRDTAFCDRVRVEADALDRYLTEPRWYQTAGRAPAAAAAPALQAAQAMQGATAQTPAPGADAQELPTRIAYFSPEFGITAALPQYSGGLGILAGDHLKSASDLGVPIVGVGLLYRSGYFKQALTREGWQSETYPVMDPDDLPLTLLRETDGTPAIVRLKLPENRTLAARVWRADVGRVPLLLLDSNVPENDIPERTVTDRLYGGGEDHRLLQELLLGIGGVRALRLWQRIDGGEAPEVFHMNEGHAGFLAVERISELTAQGLSFDEALEAVRGSTVFTTHTPVPAGIDRFKAEQIRRQFSGDLQIPGVDVERILQLGAEDYQGGTPGVFNMAVMGLRVGGRCNGVSQLHGKVSRAMFKGLWSGFDLREVPISSVTNGVHVPTWIDDELAQIEAEHLGVPMDSSRWLDPLVVSDQELWSWKRAARARLVEYARGKVRSSWLRRGASPAELGWIDEALSPDVLTIGFARRVPTYKRLTLMLRDPERLTKLLTDPDHPIQILIAGKSHPNDEQGKLLIQELVRFADAPEVRNRIVFLPNYDIAMAQYLFPGCDVWLNNPLRPLEACGTSGMKAAVNGGLNCSILDGWWDEWYDGANGWAIPTADGVQDPDRRDDLEAAALYDLIEGQIAPHFYTRDDRGIPVAWLEMVRHTLATLVPKVQATRMVTDYVTQLYTPAARMGRRLQAQGCAGAKDLAGWKARVRAAWPEVRVESVATAGVGEVVQVGDVMSFDVEVALG